MNPLPRLRVTAEPVTSLGADALVVPVFRGGIEGPGAETALRAVGLTDPPRDTSFRGRVGEVLRLAAPGQPWRSVVLVGLGRMDELSDEQARRAAGAAVRGLVTQARVVALTLPLLNPSRSMLRAVAEGALLGAYRFDELRADAGAPVLEEVALVVASGLVEDAEELLAQASAHARAQCVARDLVSTPPNLLGPVELAERAHELVPAGVELEVWDERRLELERCGGLLAVARGSARPPRLVRLRWQPAAPVARIALVGKGITFDSGGLSLKRPSTLMDEMKGDMAGAAAVLAVFAVAAELDLPVELRGELCLAENLPGDDAQRPSDVITTRDGTTVEVLNTDAEGRLVLADGLALAAEASPDAIVDVATLTGAVFRAIGKRAIGIFANDDDLLRQLLRAADDAGEAMWHLPLWNDLRDNLESPVADLENLGRGDEAGATMGGLFLREFVGDHRWAHLDIAGPFWQDEDRHHLPRHGTGIAVRTLLRWLEQLAGR